MIRRNAASLGRIGALEGFAADAALAEAAGAGVAVLEGATAAPVALGPHATPAHAVRSNDRASARVHVPVLMTG
jgi:hypothetical protein